MFQKAKQALTTMKSTVEAARVEWEAAKVALEQAERAVRTPNSVSGIEHHIAVCERELGIARSRRDLALAASGYSLALDATEADAINFHELASELRADVEAVAEAQRALEGAQAQVRLRIMRAQTQHETVRGRRERDGLPPGACFPELSSTSQTLVELFEQHGARKPSVPSALEEKISALETELQELQASAERRARDEDRVREQEAAAEARERANREARAAAPAIPWESTSIGRQVVEKSAEELALARGWLARQAARVGL
jgi:chromosome segregation ATPase